MRTTVTTAVLTTRVMLRWIWTQRRGTWTTRKRRKSRRPNGNLTSFTQKWVVQFSGTGKNYLIQLPDPSKRADLRKWLWARSFQQTGANSTNIPYYWASDASSSVWRAISGFQQRTVLPVHNYERKRRCGAWAVAPARTARSAEKRALLLHNWQWVRDGECDQKCEISKNCTNSRLPTGQ